MHRWARRGELHGIGGRRPSRLSLVAATMLALTIASVTAGCGARQDPVSAAPPEPSPASLLSRTPPPPPPAPTPPQRATPPSAPPTTVALPRPVRIPDDPYAPEPVVQIGTIEIPRMGLSTPMFEGVTLNNIDRGPSHWPGTAMPGQPGNVVVAGHRSTQGEPFRHIDDLVTGDEVIFDVGGTRTTYRVRGHMVVGPDDTWIARQTPARTATLYACHPPGTAEKRFVVRLALAV